MDLEDFLSKLEGVKQLPSGFAARCPAHDDHVASLSVNEGREGGIVLICFAGCQTEDVVSAVGLTMRDLAGAPHVVETYAYVDEEGSPLWHVERWANPKTFRCRPGLPPAAQRLLYRADWLRWAREETETIYVFEGEKDSNRAADLGLVSTCNVGGAGAWLPHYAEQVRGCPVVVVADNDAPGRKHAREVAASCATTALSVVLVVPRYGNDFSELLDLGWTMEALDPLPEEEELGVVCAANVRTRPHEWAWPGYIPFGAVTMGEGDPGDGKSITTTDLTARWSSGAPMPDGSQHGGPFNVVMISAEDDPEATIVPRLRAAGADLSRVFLVTHGVGDPSRPFTISLDLPALSRFVIKQNVKVITLDPLMAFVADDTDSHNDHSVRRAMHPLYRLAQDTGAVVLVIRHLNKGSGKAVYRGGGSIAFIGAARAAYTIGKDTEDADKRILACVKMNIAAMPPSLSFSISQTEAGPFLQWHGAVNVNAQDLVDGRRSSENEEILQFLNTVVEGEPLTWKEIVKYGSDLGYTDKMLRSRRDRSRLTKIVGSEGNRSVRWGYLNHQVNHLPDAAHMPPLTPTDPAFGWDSGKANGPAKPSASPITPPKSGVSGEGGGQVEPSGQMAVSSPDMDDDDSREQALNAAPLVCSICTTEELVNRYGHPWWVVRCLNHSPLTYGE